MASGVRRSCPTAASSAVRWRSTVASARASRPRRQAPALEGGLRRRREGLQHALVLREERRPAPDQPQVRADRHVEAQRRLRAGRRPARVLDVDHSPVAVIARLERHGLHPERLARLLEHPVQRRSLVEVGSGERRERLGLRARLLGRAARRAASSTAPLTIAATTTKTTSATAWSACATSSVCTGATKK